VVAAPEAQAAEVGCAILRRGGNAVDAAIAVQFAICVTNPIGAGLGGGGFMLIHAPGTSNGSGGSSVVALDYREAAPSGAHRDMFLDSDGEVDDDLSIFSALAAGIPGTVRGMAEAHARYGSLPWNELLEPAIRLARDGFIVDEWTAGSFDEHGATFAALPEPFRAHVEFGDYYDAGAGATLKLPDLAATLQRIADEGADEFYTGKTARLLVEEMGRTGGLITAEDLAGYRAIWREPASSTFRDHGIVSMPPPSSGGVSMIQFLNFIERFDVRCTRPTRCICSPRSPSASSRIVPSTWAIPISTRCRSPS